MTTTLSTLDLVAVSDRPTATGTVTFPRAVRSEWIKFGSLRSTWATLAAAVAGLVLLGLVIAYNTGRNRVGLAPEDLALSATLQGYHLSELAVGVLGVLFVSGEYTTGMIRSTLAAVPKRFPVVLAKVTVLTAVLLLPVLFGQLLGTWGKDLPNTAGQSFIASLHAEHTLAPGAGLAVLVGWVAVALVAANVLLRHKDA